MNYDNYEGETFTYLLRYVQFHVLEIIRKI